MKKVIQVVLICLFACNILLAQQAPSINNKGLKDYYKNYFPIGVAVNLRAITDYKSLILSQFNSITPENSMKMGPIHPQENRYYWRDADSIVNFAHANHLRIRGHNLCWH